MPDTLDGMDVAPSLEERTNAGAHVLYEINSLSDILAVLLQLEASDDDYDEAFGGNTGGVLRNAALEALLVHVRCLIEFLVGRPPSKGNNLRRRDTKDIPPAWFAPRWETPTGAHELDEWLALIDAHLSHLSRKRIRFNDDGERDAIIWTEDMLHGLLVQLDLFRSHLVGTNWQPGFDHGAAQLRRLLRESQGFSQGS